MADELNATPMDRWKYGSDNPFTIKASGKKQRVKSIDEIAEEVKRKDAELRAKKEAIERDKTKPLEIVRNGDSNGFPKKHEFNELQQALEELRDKRLGITRCYDVKY